MIVQGIQERNGEIAWAFRSCGGGLPQYLINNGSWTLLEQTIWLWNHTSYTKVYFNEFVANVLCDNMGMIIFWPPRFWRLLEAKNIVSLHTLWHFKSMFSSSLSASFTYKDSPRNEITYDLQPPYLKFYNQACMAWFLVFNIYIKNQHYGFKIPTWPLYFALYVTSLTLSHF